MSNAFLTRLSAILIVVTVLLVSYVGCQTRKKDKQIDQLSNLISALNDTLKVTKLKDSSQQATIQSLTTSKTKDFLALKTKDSTINSLQNVVRKYEKQLQGGGAAVVVKGETNVTATGTTEVTWTQYDTIYNPVFPIYKSTIKNKWYTIKTVADKDTTRVDLKIINAYDVILGKENGKWFALVTNHNPYSSTQSMRAYNVEVPKTRTKRVSLAIFGGYGLNVQGSVVAAPVIGIGVGYTILPIF